MNGTDNYAPVCGVQHVRTVSFAVWLLNARQTRLMCGCERDWWSPGEAVSKTK